MKHTRILAVLLALVMMLGLVACSTTPAETPSDMTVDTPAADTQTPADEPAEEPADEPAEEPVETPADEPAEEPADEPVEAPEVEPAAVSYPLCAPGEITLTWMRSAMQEAINVFEDDFSQNVQFREMEKLTGIHVEFDFLTDATWNEQFNLMLVAEDYPDIASAAPSACAGSADQAYEDEVIIRLNDYMELIPNYLNIINTVDTWANAVTDQGNLMGFYYVAQRNQPNFCGYCVRGDWMEDLGLEMPEIIDDWYQILLAFKEHKTGGVAPMDIANTGMPIDNWFAPAYGVNSVSPYLLQDNGKVFFSPTTDGYRAYLANLAKWYAEGLINQDFLSLTGFEGMGAAPAADRLANNQSGVLPALYTLAGATFANIGQAEEGFFAEMAKQPTLERGVPNKVGVRGTDTTKIMQNGAVIFTTCEYIPETVSYLDYIYSEDGILLSNYGVEGETFYYDEEGKPHAGDLLANNPDGLTFGQAREVYLTHTGAKYYLLDPEEESADPYALNYYNTWNDVGEWNLTNALTFTAEEQEERASLLTDIQTYVAEYSTKVIAGIEPLNDETWNTFVSQLGAMKADRVVEITQAAYDRYLAR